VNGNGNGNCHGNGNCNCHGNGNCNCHGNDLTRISRITRTRSEPSEELTARSRRIVFLVQTAPGTLHNTSRGRSQEEQRPDRARRQQLLPPERVRV